MYERTIKLTKEKLTTRIQEIQRRHMAAAKLNANNVVTKEKDKWEVKSEDENGCTLCKRLMTFVQKATAV